jgi:hypothetical protein
MKYLILFALLFMLVVSCGLQYAPAAPAEPEPTPEPQKPAPPKPEVIPLARELKPIPTPEPTPEIIIDPYEAELIAKTLYGEYRGPDKLQQAGVAWCIVNRCDAWGETVETVVTAPNQFLGYRASNPVEPYLYDMAVDVLTRWEREKLGETDVGRVLPADYLWFGANKSYTKNIFRNAFTGGDRWDWAMPNPYEE